MPCLRARHLNPTICYPRVGTRQTFIARRFIYRVSGSDNTHADFSLRRYYIIIENYCQEKDDMIAIITDITLAIAEKMTTFLIKFKQL